MRTCPCLVQQANWKWQLDDDTHVFGLVAPSACPQDDGKVLANEGRIDAGQDRYPTGVGNVLVVLA